MPEFGLESFEQMIAQDYACGQLVSATAAQVRAYVADASEDMPALAGDYHRRAIELMFS